MKDVRPKTIICDIDGTLVQHDSPLLSATSDYKMTLLSGTKEKLAEWDRKGYNIILLTGRRESMRKMTENQLSAVGIFYDQLIMGVGGGKRVLVNDRKPNGSEDYAMAINLTRNEGIGGINV